MGYDLHITRAQDWTDSESIPITGAEWKALVASDPQLELIGAAEAAAPDGVLRYENPGLARWSGHTTDEEVWFDLRQGRVVVKNPDEATIAKMVAVASALGARVVGDDGETYDSSGVPPGPPPVSFAQRVAAWFHRMRPSPAPDVALPPFAVGAGEGDGRRRHRGIGRPAGHAWARDDRGALRRWTGADLFDVRARPDGALTGYETNEGRASFQRPRVKSGNSIADPPDFTDISDSGAGALQAAAS